jgi:hypothetical protein
MEAGAVSNARYSRIRRTIQMRVRWPRQADYQNDTFCRWLHREPSNPYGLGFSRKVRKTMEDTIKEVKEEEREFEEAHFYRARGPVPRSHCKRCKRFVTTTKQKNHVIMCKESQKMHN